ncbi:MAG: DJ-1/PfpI family protein [Myxococcota bacterium]
MTSSPRTLGALFYDQFELLDMYGPLEMFASIEPGIEIVSVADRKGPVGPVRGPKTDVEYDFEDCPKLDLLLVPGGLGTIAALANEPLLDFLRKRSDEAEVVMSVCSGSALLAKAGVLDGQRATSNKQFFDLAAQQSDRVEWVPEARWVDAGKMVTSSGVSAGMDMAIGVIRRLYSDEEAERICALTEYQPHTDPDTDPFAKYLNAMMPSEG